MDDKGFLRKRGYVMNLVSQFLAYDDDAVTDNPYMRAFDQTRRLQSIPIANPTSNAMTIPPGQSNIIFDGTVPNSLNGSSIMSISLVNAQNSIYRLQVTSGPAGFKTARAPTGLASYATYTDILDTPNIVFTALTPGPIGNAIELVFPLTYANATDTLDTPNIVFTANTPGGAGDLISLVFNGVAAFATDTLDTPNITFTAVNAGVIGNSISLTFDGIATVGYIVDEWNTDNPSNQVSYTGLATVVPMAQTLNLSTGSGDTVSYVVNQWNGLNPSNQVSYTGSASTVPRAQTIDLSGGDGLTVGEVVTAWNSANPSNQVSATGSPSVVPAIQTVNLVAPQNCSVTINNASVAVFNFSGATLTGVVVGDILRISGLLTNDPGPYAFNPLNAGFWSIIGVNGTALSCIRLTGQPFSGVTENVAVGASDVQIFATDGLQPGYKFALTGTFSEVSQRTYEVLQVTPTMIDFVSAIQLPLESGLTYVPSTFVAYSEAKRFVAVEVDQDAAIQFNGDMSSNVTINPIKPGSKDLPGVFLKWGNAYSCTIVNQSINPLKVKFWTGE